MLKFFVFLYRIFIYNMSIYKEKYLKYKMKYLQLKTMIGGNEKQQKYIINHN